MADKDVLKMPTMQEYAIGLVGAAAGSGILKRGIASKGKKGAGSLVAASAGSRALKKSLKRK
tara:strand:- start:34 stop:219 length:186 start_codon:yes stop_codon:yes gene_type:complete